MFSFVSSAQVRTSLYKMNEIENKKKVKVFQLKLYRNGSNCMEN